MFPYSHTIHQSRTVPFPGSRSFVRETRWTSSPAPTTLSLLSHLQSFMSPSKEGSASQSCFYFSFVVVWVLTIIGALNFDTRSQFERTTHTGIIIKADVSGGTTYHASTKSNEATYYIRAIVTYPLVGEHNATSYKNCTLMLNSYSKRSTATSRLKKVPIGKQKEVHVSKHFVHYCIDTQEFNYYYTTGLALFITVGAWVALALSVCACDRHKTTASTVMPTQGEESNYSAATVTPATKPAAAGSNGKVTDPYWAAERGNAGGGGGGDVLPTFYNQPYVC
jgi:hypothetical protein